GHALADHVSAGHVSDAAGRYDARGQDADGCGLARPVGADESEELPLVDNQVQPLERYGFAATTWLRTRRRSPAGLATGQARAARGRIYLAQPFRNYRCSHADNLS